MMKKLQFKRIFSLAVMTLLIMGGGINSTLNAQKSDGFFRGGIDDSYINRDGTNSEIDLGGTINQDPTAPLGSGLLIMLAAGAGYAVVRRNRKSTSKIIKSSSTLLIALALILGMTQCKKSTVAPTPTSNQVQITLNANFDGSRTSFNPEGNEGNGTFAWSTSNVEYINVGGNATGYLGQLSNDGSGSGTFTGSFDIPDGNSTLYFFYLGNGNHAGATTVDFSNQNGTDVTNCHIAVGSAAYTGQSSLSVTLEAQIAIAKFNLSAFGSETVYLSGADVYSTASVNYTNGTIIGSKKGLINVGTASAEKYVALIPSVSDETTLNFNSSSKQGSIDFKSSIQAAYFYTATGHEALAVTATEGGSIPYTFSVSDTKKVIFSQGNLQYQASTGTWRFAEHQYDYIGSAIGNTTTGDTRATQSNWIDIFSWATSGYDNTAIDEYAIRFQPYLATISTEVNSTYNQFGYGPSTYMTDKNLVGTSAKYDWGVYNTISNGGTGWRTLTQGNGEGEWFYLLGLAGTPNPGTNCRSVNNTLSVQARYTMATIGGTYKGLIIFPDVYVHPDGTDFVAGTFNAKSDYTATVSVDGWKKMEAAGAVFLPAAGYRTYNVTITNPNAQGRYWSVNYYDKSQARYVYFTSSTFGAGYINRCYGCSVRLVKDVK